MANKHPNLDNLTNKGKGFESREIAQKEGAKGGKQLGENNKERKNMRELAQAMLDCRANENNKKIIENEFPELDNENLTNSTMLLAKVFSKALKGDIKAFEVLRDTSGQKPIDTVHNTGQQLVAITSDENKIQSIIDKAKNA